MKRYILLFLLIAITVYGKAQSTRTPTEVIKGKVIDSASGKPIVNASVYLNGSSTGTTSNSEGNFTLNVSGGEIPLVVSHIGYQSQIIHNYTSQNLKIVLNPKSIELREVVIAPGGISRKREMDIFLTEFIGSTGNDCVISNPDDIYFTYHKKNDSLTANADKPLIIYNKKLGYKITYFLAGFNYTPAKTFYQGNYFFAEDTLGLQSKEVKKIIKARDEAYLGSRMHFIRSLWAGALQANDFTIYNFLLISPSTMLSERDILSAHNNKRFITLTKAIPIVYKDNNNHSSILKMANGHTEAIIDSNGFYGPELIWSGPMAMQRVNQLLPFEFKPTKVAPHVANKPVDRKFIADTLFARLVDRQDTLLKHQQPEKLYLQTDKNTYGLLDTLWFKAYLFNATSLQASSKSNIVYIEISDESNLVQIRRLVVMNNGLGSGSIVLNRRDFPEGGYTLRTYTQWMRNFGESLIFKKQFYVGDLNKDKWLVTYNPAFQNQTARLHFQLYQTNKQFVSNQLVQLGIKQGERTLQWDKIQTTSPLGALDLAVSLPDKPDPRYATLQKAVNQPGAGFAGLGSVNAPDVNAPVYKFPIIYNRSEKTDVQFMPEGGYLVNGINSVVGFKAIGEDGKGVNISGSIVNGSNEEVATFKSNPKGMGSFPFTPQASTTYKAVVNLPGGIKKEYPLPAVKPGGTVLSINNSQLSDTLIIKVTASPGLDTRYILLGQSRGLICVAARVVLVNNTKILKVPKSAFPAGIARFTLLNTGLATLNERICYIDQKDNLKITVTPDKISYSPQDSIALQVEVKDMDDQPVKGYFSMSVVNDLQLNNNQNNSSIATSLLLTSDLKGNIEDPEYYFTADHPGSPDSHREQALDDLLLTQGWTGYNWKEVSRPEKQPEFTAEPDFSIGGKVINLFDKPVKGAKVSLLSTKPLYNNDVQTNDKGIFIFKNIPQTDSAIYMHARNEKGNSSTYEIDLDKPDWPEFSKNQLQMPWYVNTDTTRLKIADTILRNAEKLDNLEGLGGKVLKTVDIKDKKIIPGSHNLNGPGNADQVIDEHDIAKEKKPITLLELLQKQVKGFRTVGLDRRARYFIRTEPIYSFIVDGVDIHAVRMSAYELLSYYTSDDVKGIEVMSESFTSSYELKFIPPPTAPSFPIPFIEITTRQGKGPLMKKHPADLVYKPIPAVSPKEFYRPAYPVKNAVAAAFDNRTTIHWEPDIITDKNGKATVTFYAAGQPATYTITTEGSNMNGNVGSSVQKLTIK